MKRMTNRNILYQRKILIDFVDEVKSNFNKERPKWNELKRKQRRTERDRRRNSLR